MEQVKWRQGLQARPQGSEAGRSQRDSFVESVLTDAALDELKRQSAKGCLLCSLDALDDEEWE